MLAWDALVLLAALLDGLRLPRARKLTAGRSWTNAPALDSETEIELTIENHGPHHRRLPPGGRSAAAPGGRARHPPAHRLSPRAGLASLSRGTTGARRLRDGLALRALPLAARPGRALGQGAAHANGARLSRRCAPARSSRSFWPAAARSTCNCARRSSAAWAATSRACASTAKATTCATSAGRPPRGAAAPSPASTRPSAASRCGSCSTAGG